MASFSGPKLSNRIADDVPDIQAVLSSHAKLTPDSGNSDYPIGTKRVAETTNGYEFQQYNGTGWVTLEKWNLDAQKVDGYSASTGTTANTIPVRNANGKLPGDILGNAATATKANALSETNPIPMGGTGATTAEQARANLGTPPKTHASTSTEYGTGTSTQYGHLKSHDAPDATLTAATGHAFSPAGAASMKAELEEQIEEVETEASTQVSSLDTSLRALIAQEVGDAESTASQQVAGLDAALRALIAEELAKYLLRDGGSCGPLTIVTDRDKGSITLTEIPSSDQGGRIVLGCAEKEDVVIDRLGNNLRFFGASSQKIIAFDPATGILSCPYGVEGASTAISGIHVVRADKGFTVPAGGTWFVFSVTDVAGLGMVQQAVAVAGGTYLNWNWYGGTAGYTAVMIRTAI